MFLRLRLPRHSAYNDTFFWSGDRRDNEVRLYSQILVISKSYLLILNVFILTKMVDGILLVTPCPLVTNSKFHEEIRIIYIFEARHDLWTAQCH